ncbi:zinc-dependent metalloprotease [Dyadobacter psychrophilus]|uniref:Por secretion system C-terminal sorting domain-containing protein n=1 Tax=Dyadobacter psychrophilus TaxID=651661 RepID=A0A1T5DU74_9BACT|nr:zinc-dependent metalloprotease [Dyadobacter psychrophilus]SKB75318.1 Por secretion system C-terminal sorting domain-containing protein [Dyadobacter psychrophilus]
MKISFTKIICLILLFLAHAVFTTAQHGPPVCGTNDSLSASRLQKYSRSKDLTRARTAGDEMLEYRLALDINYKTYLLYGGDKALITRKAVKFINEASAIFERDINVKLTITSILIWDHPEPYALDDDFQYYNNVQNYWLFNRSDERDAVVGFSVRDGWFYGGYRMCTSNFPKPEMSDLPVDLLCHELGHTLGSPHTHNCYWPGGPIDRCTTLDGASVECEEGYQESVNGSIMSYCRSVLSFHPLCQNLMRDYAEGRIDESFKLNAITEHPNTPDSLTIYEDNAQEASHTPSFRWKTPFGVNKYRFQIARDAAFANIVEDTLVAQSHFTSVGQREGDYFARVLSMQIPKAALWSETLPFTISPYNEKSSPPLLLQLDWKDDGFLSGTFHKYDGIQSYQVEVADKNQTDGVIFHDFSATEPKIQHFNIPLASKGFERYAVRLRVKKDDIWSRWSYPTFFSSPWTSQVWAPTNLSNTSANPIIAVSTYASTLHTGFLQNIEVAEDEAFKNIVFRDSVALNGMNESFVNKAIFQPVLEENKTYYARTRVQYMPGIFTSWKNFELSTNWNDTRFEFLGVVSKNLLSTTNSYGATLKNRLYNAGDKLFVFDINNGYYTTKDLKTWEASTTTTTKGRSPNIINLFGASKSGDVFAMSFNNVLLKRNVSGAYEHSFANEKFATDAVAPFVVTSSAGIFFATIDRGVGHFQNGKWIFYGANVLTNDHAICVAADADDHVWALMQEGLIYSFENNTWIAQPAIRNFRGLVGIAFDNEGDIYAYGEPGVFKLNRSTRSWEPVFSLNGYVIRKIIFDKDNRMWAASYGISEQNYEPHALIRFKDQKATIYSDGLNMLKEPFDLTIFNNKLLILTTGGELHAFDEENFQRFQPKASYTAGDEIALTLTTNTTFGKNNEASFILRNVSSNETIKITGRNIANKTYTFKIPMSIKEGMYRLKTVTTEPEVTSNESVAFKITPSASYNMPTEVTLMQNVPNPAGTTTDIAFFLPNDELTTLTLYNVKGQKIRLLAEGKYPAGWHIARLDGQNLASGLYIYRLKAGNVTKTLKMIR